MSEVGGKIERMIETLVRGWTEAEPDPATLLPDAWKIQPAGRDLSEVPTEQLEAEICVLAGHLAAAAGSWLGLVAEFDRRNGWAGPGLRSCAQWLAWKVGLSLHTAREHVRVARALTSLPLVRAEMAAGRLSYAKARAITRIADSYTEAALVEIGLSGTATHVERVVAGYRRAQRPTARPSGRPARFVSTRWDDDGSLVLRARLTADEGAVVVAALDAMRHQLAKAAEQAARDEAAATEPGAEPETEPAAERDLATTVDQHDTGDPTGADETVESCEIDETAEAFRSSAADAFVAMVTSALEHGPVDDSGADRFQVIIHADLDQLRAEAGAADEPAASDEPPSRTDENDVGTGTGTGAGTGEGGPADHPADREAAIASGRTRLRRGRCHLGHGGPCLHPTTLHRILCDASVRVMIHDEDGTPMDQGRRKRLVTPRLRRAVEDRDGGRCQFPGCEARHHLHVHHILAWFRGGKTDLANLVLLCGFHHRLLHEHGYTIDVVAPGRYRFRRPDGTPVPDAPPTRGDPRLDRLRAPLHQPPPVTPSTTTPTWGGDRLDLPYVVSLMFPPERAETAA